MRGCQALCCSSSPSFGAWISLREIKEIIVSNECEKICPSVKTEDRGATTPGTQKTTTRAIQTFLVKGSPVLPWKITPHLQEGTRAQVLFTLRWLQVTPEHPPKLFQDTTLAVETAANVGTIVPALIQQNDGKHWWCCSLHTKLLLFYFYRFRDQQNTFQIT